MAPCHLYVLETGHSTWAQAASRSLTRTDAKRSAAAWSGKVVVTWQQPVRSGIGSMGRPRRDASAPGVGRQPRCLGATLSVIERGHHRAPPALELNRQDEAERIGLDIHHIRQGTGVLHRGLSLPDQ